MIWLWLMVLVVAVLSLTFWLGRVSIVSLALVAVALLLGLFGYALQGQPGLVGAPVVALASDDGFGEAPIGPNDRMTERFGPQARWLAMAYAFLKRGKTELAVNIIRSGLERYPDNVDLWVALGNALIVHGGGELNPAATLAFDEAATRAPEHPAPPFYKGLALARSGDFAKAEAVWAALLANSPVEAPWRVDLEQRLAGLRALRVATHTARHTSIAPSSPPPNPPPPLTPRTQP